MNHEPHERDEELDLTLAAWRARSPKFVRFAVKFSLTFAPTKTG
jgi:hypothetical protein